MEEKRAVDVASHFASLEDPGWIAGNGTSYWTAFSSPSVTCSAEPTTGWVDIEECGKAKQEWLWTFLDLPNGIPSHDTFGWVSAHLDPVQFEQDFFRWVQGLSETMSGVITIDGKTVRISRAGKREAGTASGECLGSENRLELAQVATGEKSNEMTAIPHQLCQLEAF